MPAICKTLEPSEQNIDFCADLLRSGKVVGIPTETVYGLAGNALVEESIRKIFTVKGRPLIDPLIVHFPTPSAALEHIEATEKFEELATRFWPGPMTLVVSKKPSIPDIATAGLSSVAVRVPSHPVFQSLLERLAFPLAAPSANPFGYVSPTQAKHVQITLGERISAVLDGGNSKHGLESTIIDLRDPKVPTLLRHGPITKREIQHCLGRKVTDLTKSSKVGRAQTAPGMMTQHYSPNASVHLVEDDSELAKRSKTQRTANIYLRKPVTTIDQHDYWFSEDGDLQMIAHNMFALIQRLDQLNYTRINIAKAPHSGIGKAINDRLSRAAIELL